MPVLSLTQIAENVNLPKSTVHRLIATLGSKRFLIRDAARGKYRLGYQFLDIASRVLTTVNQEWVLPYLKRLAEECGETVDLAVMDGDHVIYLQVVESTQRVKLAAALGQRLPAFCTASGKAFLAFLPYEDMKLILHTGLKRYTEHTHQTFPDLYKDLEVTRQRGFAISRQEYENDINAVAAPILETSGYPIAAIAVAGPSFRLPEARMLELGGEIRSVIESITCEVGLATVSVMVPHGDSWKK